MIFFNGLLSYLFFVIGLLIVLSHVYYKIKGRRIVGEVIGIEKYISTTRTSNRTSKSLMYRPLIKYLFNGVAYTFVSSGRNSIVHTVGQKINLINLPTSAKLTRVDSYFSLIFGLIFSIVSIFPAQHFFSRPESDIAKLVCIISYIVISIAAYRKAQSFDKNENIILQVLSISSFETKESLAGREIFTSANEIKTEEKKHFKLGMVLTLVMFLLMLALFVQCYTNMSSQSFEFINNFMSVPFSKSELESLFKRDPKFVGALFSSVMMLLCSYSLIIQIRKR